MNYMEMKPSRELDAVISKEVFNECPHPVEKELSEWVCPECGEKIAFCKKSCDSWMP
mgnify:CR=1 FL=1